MEKVYPHILQTQTPGVYLRSFGKGKVAYFPWDIDRTFWEVLCVDHGRLLWNCVDWALDGCRDIRVEGPGVLDVTVWQQAASLTVHLVNLTNPMLMKGPLRELLPTGRLQVRLRLPGGKPAREVRCLVDGGTPAWQQDGDWLSLTLALVLDHEVIAVDF